MSLIDRVLAGAFTPTEIEDFLDGVFARSVDPVVVSGLLIALRTQAVSGPMLAAGARVLRRHAVRVHAPDDAIDTCGTGGDGSGTVNISTAAALVVACCGGIVAKHGNRAVSSRSGSADVLEAFGIPIDLDSESASAAMRRTGFAFLMAPRFHPAMASVAPIRRALGVRTLFNLLGPLANPALVRRQIVGVYDPALTRAMCEALAELGSERALVVSCAGLDEIGLHADTTGHELRGGEIVAFRHPGRGIALAELAGGDAAHNAKLLTTALQGGEGAIGLAIAVNAGAALWVAGLADSMAEGEERARAAMRMGVDIGRFR